MNNPFQDQLLKAGVVTKQQVHKANQEKSRKRKQQKNKKAPPVDQNKIRLQKLAEEKAQRDRELNQRKEQQAKSKAISQEINQLIEQNLLKRDESCDIVYNFEHRNKVNRIYVDDEMKQKIIAGKLGIARIEGRYELVPLAIAEKIKQRNEKRIVLLEEETPAVAEDDPYADYQVPDDLVW